MTHDTETLPAWSTLVDDPADAALSRLTEELAALDGPADEAGDWPEAIWSRLIAHRVPHWSLPKSVRGDECDRLRLLARYARVAEGSLTAAFVLSQHDAGVRRLAASLEHPAAHGWLELVGDDEAFATVGISQLTTSRRHGAKALAATPEANGEGGYRLEGVMPWVTAAVQADVIVTGAALDDGRQLLIALPTDRPGLVVRPAFPLAALQASCTSEVTCRHVHVEPSFVLAGPAADVMAHPGAAGTGGLETSALALGQSRAALVALVGESSKRSDLAEPIEALVADWRETWQALAATATADARPDAPTPAQVRARANALVLRATQSYLTARKGTGFLRTEPAQRWARQALFFLVWSCPGPVAEATLRDLAGICSA